MSTHNGFKVFLQVDFALLVEKITLLLLLSDKCFFISYFLKKNLLLSKFDNNGHVFDNKKVVMQDIISSLLTDGSLRVY